MHSADWAVKAVKNGWMPYYPQYSKSNFDIVKDAQAAGHTTDDAMRKHIVDQLVSGDTLFIQGCGRVDLPGSNVDDMYHSMKRLAELPNDTVLLPGHRYSPESHDTMENIKANNFYLSVKSLEIWRNMMG